MLPSSRTGRSTQGPLGEVLGPSSIEAIVSLTDPSWGTPHINRLAQTGVLTERNVGKERYRVFEGTGVLELFTSLERSLASPTGNTLTSPPDRPAPNRFDPV